MPQRLHVPRIIALAPCGSAEPGVVVAACRAGALGALDFGVDFSASLAVDAASRAARFLIDRPLGLRLPAVEIQATLLKGSPTNLNVLIGTEADGADWDWAAEQALALRRILLAEVTTAHSAREAALAGATGLILVGLEAGGLTGSQSGPELLRVVLELDLGLPLWVRGGIGPASAAALVSAGAQGVVLDGALLLSRESPVPAEIQARLAAGAAEESLFLGQAGQERYRVILHSKGLIQRFARKGDPHPPESSSALSGSTTRDFKEVDASPPAAHGSEPSGLDFELADLRARVGWAPDQAWPGGLDATFAAVLARKFPTVGRIVQEVERSLRWAGDSMYDDFIYPKASRDGAKFDEIAIVGVALRGRRVASAPDYWRSLVLYDHPIAAHTENSREGSVVDILQDVWRAAGHGDEAPRELLTPKVLEIAPDGSALGALDVAVRELAAGTAGIVAVAWRTPALSGAIALRRRSDAERDGDPVLCILRGVSTAVGSIESATEKAVEHALRSHEIRPTEIGLVDFADEPGSRTDVSWMTGALAEGQDASSRPVLGSMPGHASVLPGLVELIRASMALHHRVFPATSGFATPGVAAALERAPFPVNRRAKAWFAAASQAPRRAVVGERSAARGAAIALLESYEDDPLPRPSLVENWPFERAAEPAESFQDFASTARDGLQNGNGGGRREDALAQARDEHSTRQRVAWLFSDAPATSVNLRELAIVYPQVRSLIEAVDAHLTAAGAKPVGDWLAGASAGQSTRGGPHPTPVVNARWIVSCLAFARLLRAAGVEPDLVAGMRFGELIGLHVAGAIALDELISRSTSSLSAEVSHDEPSWTSVRSSGLGAFARRSRMLPSHRLADTTGRGGEMKGFETTIEGLHADGTRVFIDFSPNNHLAAALEHVLRQRPYRLVRLAPRGGSLREWLEALADLADAGVADRLVGSKTAPHFAPTLVEPRPPSVQTLARVERSQFHVSPLSTSKRADGAVTALAAMPKIEPSRRFAAFQESMRSFLIEQRNAIFERFADQDRTNTDDDATPQDLNFQARPKGREWSRHCWRFGDAPLPSAGGGLAAGGVVLITDDGRGIGRAVAADLRAAGYAVVRVRHGVSEPGVEGVNLCSEAAVSAFVDRARTMGGIAAIAHLLPLRIVPSWTDMSFSGWTARFAPEVRGLFLLARAAADDLERSADQGGAALIAASALGGSFGLDARSPLDGFPGQGGLRGFVRGLGHASSPVRIRAVDFDASDDVEVLGAHLVREMLTYDRSPTVSYQLGRRLAPRITPSPRRTQLLEPNGPILIAGPSVESLETLAAAFSRSTSATVLALVLARDPRTDEAARWLASPAESRVHRGYAAANDAAAINEQIDDWEQEHASIATAIYARGSVDGPRESESALEHFDRVVNGQIEEALRVLNVAGVRSCPTIVLASGRPESQPDEVLIHDVTAALSDALAGWLAARGKRRALSVQIDSGDDADWPVLILEELAREVDLVNAVSFQTAPTSFVKPITGSDES
jgi:NAD(P)H-dependent flavin oxidoreductase YrpB (nitropropane dioxygenase family)